MPLSKDVTALPTAILSACEALVIGVTVIVAVWEVLDVLTTPKAGIDPLPVPGNPIEVLSFVQLYSYLLGNIQVCLI